MLTENLVKRPMVPEKPSHIIQNDSQQRNLIKTNKGDKTMKIVSCTLAAVAGACFVSGLIILTN